MVSKPAATLFCFGGIFALTEIYELRKEIKANFA